MASIYDFGIRLFAWGLQLAALVHPKARLWVAGRRHWRSHYPASFKKKGLVLWVHAASLGEFEQGRPVIEAFRPVFPDWQIVLTFFSPSGYEIRKNYPHADFICYLPADTRRNARDFLDLIRPDAAIFIKYEFWANYLFELKRRDIPTLSVSTLFRPGQPFFRWYGGFWRAMLGCFSHFFVQNAASAQLLHSIGLHDCTVAGDTRVDRVLQLAGQAGHNTILEAFAGDHPVFIAGSSWPADESVFLPVLQSAAFRAWRIVIAPHEPSEKHLARLLPRLTRRYTRYSEWVEKPADVLKTMDAEILVVDNVGLLNTLYRYGAVAYIGGGFGKGIHNTLEPAAFGLPVLFGPRYEKFEEARQFVTRGGAFAVSDSAALDTVLEKLQQPAFYQQAAHAIRDYLAENSGATEKVIAYLTNAGGTKFLKV